MKYKKINLCCTIKLYLLAWSYIVMNVQIADVDVQILCVDVYRQLGPVRLHQVCTLNKTIQKLLMWLSKTHLARGRRQHKHIVRQ